MLFFYVFIITAAVLSALLLKVKVVVIVNNAEIDLTAVIFGFIKFSRKYVVKYEDKNILTLYYKTSEGLKAVINLQDIIHKIKESMTTNVSLVDIITLFTQKLLKRPRNKALIYIYNKMNYILSIRFKIGVGDAFISSMICGFFNAAGGIAASIINSTSHKINVQALPEFSKNVFHFRAECIINIAAADIIIGYIKGKIKKRR